MSTDPAFASVINNNSATVSATLDTSLTAPTNAVTVFTAGANGSAIYEMVLEGLLTTVAGVCNIFLHDGSTYHLFEQALVTAITSSTTATAYRWNKAYPNLYIKNGWTVRFTQTIAGNQSGLKLSVFGADL